MANLPIFSSNVPADMNQQQDRLTLQIAIRIGKAKLKYKQRVINFCMEVGINAGRRKTFIIFYLAYCPAGRMQPATK